jgi:transcriptional regulator with XRE-family HTH domain
MKSSAVNSPAQVFGAMLKSFRTQSGLSSDQLGSRIHMSGSQIRKVEEGSRTLSRGLVEACEDIPELGCGGALIRLYGILEGRLKRPYPGWFAEWPEHEAAAKRLRSFELVVVPGLLQTEDYARAILGTGVDLTADELAEAVAARMDRQAILERDSPPELWVIMDETVLRRTVGSAATMRKQFEHLADAARRPRIVVQVIPLDGGAHQGLNGGAFVIADFEDAATLAYQDTAVAGQIVADASEAEALTVAWDTLRLEALPRAASLSLIEEVARSWT